MMDIIIIHVLYFHWHFLDSFPLLIFNDFLFVRYVLYLFHFLILHDYCLIWYVFKDTPTKVKLITINNMQMLLIHITIIYTLLPPRIHNICSNQLYVHLESIVTTLLCNIFRVLDKQYINLNLNLNLNKHYWINNYLNTIHRNLRTINLLKSLLLLVVILLQIKLLHHHTLYLLNNPLAKITRRELMIIQ